MINNTKNKKLISNFMILLIFIFLVFWAILLLNTFIGDPSIYLIYAKNISKGDFFSFNPKQFSSGSTSPLWAMILSLGFLVPNGVIITKIISLIFTLLAVFLTYKMSFQISQSGIGSALGIAFLLYFLAFPGLMIYESSLIIFLISILIILNLRIIFHQHKETIRKNILGIFLICSLIPLVRPDAIIIVFFNLIILLYLFFRNKKLLFLTLTLFLFSLLPSIFYFGYSYLTLGTFSVSSYCRAFALKESAKTYSGFFYSLSAIKLFFKFPWNIGIGFTLWGWEKYRKQSSVHQYLVYFSFLVLTSYLLMLSFISPVTNSVQRYILPTIPFLIPFASIGFDDFLNILMKKKYNTLLIGLFLLFMLPILSVTKKVIGETKRGLTFNIITEKGIIDYLNAIGDPNATVLVYEVQDRYYLRPDLKLLSLDGITDGKIAPYLNNENISSFLWKYKPKYWLANDAVFYRSFLSKSILKQVVEKSGKIEGDSVRIDGITFTNIRIRKEPMIKGFAAFRQVYKINYE